MRFENMSGFQLGEAILTSKPYAYVLNNTCRGQRCDYCFKKQEDLKRCSKCTFLYFCNRTCQEKSWDTHKAECRLIRKAKPNEPTAAMRLISLILLKLEKFGYEEPCEVVYGRKVSFQTLMSHVEELKQNMKSWQIMMALLGTLKNYICKIPLPTQFIEIFGKMCINTFSILDNEMQSIGSGIYLGASVFDHSCNPDAEIVFDGVMLSVRAIKNMPHRNINQIYISYIDQLQLTKDRQEALKEQYYFCCQCEWCISPKYNDMMMKLMITEKGTEYSVAELNKELEKIKEMKKSNVDPSTIFSACFDLMARQDKILANSHICKVKTLEITFDVCIEKNMWANALTYGEMLLEPYRLYYGPYHPSLGVHLFKIGKLELLLGLKTSWQTLQEAESILKITHGEDHPLYQDLLKEIYESQLFVASCNSITEE